MSKILGFFVNPLTAGKKYSLLNRGNLLQHFQMELSRKQKAFSLFFWLHFLNLNSILNIFKKNLTLLAYLFLNLPTPKYVFKQMSKK